MQVAEEQSKQGFAHSSVPLLRESMEHGMESMLWLSQLVSYASSL
jgi:hypothetical protein